MGFFSWMTADTRQSIANVYSGRDTKPVYLLQPGGEPPIREDAYEGYGEFGGQNAYEWLALANIPTDRIAEFSEPDWKLHMVGVSLAHGSYYCHRDTGANYSIFHPVPDLFGLNITHLACTFAQPCPEFGGLSPNEALRTGLLECLEVPRPKHPLKFSFDPNAVYEDLGVSQNCPWQGYFYSDDEEDEDELEDG
ncbi:hypothetical protein [Croceicoccus gelatinilyticus]|uniref:hypothetical protein n=1 Tax=Croceicoccus gelatinilyticus TaxID=2835536 RepID=UPI001BD17D9E|nr:hypothetical protein [Croceicoccus gelatinilyticus]MBS7671599.1 hypothetical protein [Croceicoccus gelatinilyticus]